MSLGHMRNVGSSIVFAIFGNQVAKFDPALQRTLDMVCITLELFIPVAVLPTKWPGHCIPIRSYVSEGSQLCRIPVSPVADTYLDSLLQFEVMRRSMIWNA